MADFPAELSTGMVHGRFIVAVIDGEDEGQEPDVVPAQGKVAFKASVGYIPVPVATGGPVTVMKGPITGVLDGEGYLSTPHPTTGEPMYRGVKLLATDDPDMAVTDWTWAADYRFESVNGVTLQIPAHSFALPSGTVVDLTTMVKVPSSPGYGLPQAEAAALRAEAAAQVALDVKAMADAGEFDGAQGPAGNATMRVDNTVGTRVFITDGTTEQLVRQDTGYRDITSILPTGLSKASTSNASVPTIRRIGDTVTVELFLDCTAGGLTTVLITPAGFKPRAIISRPNLMYIDTAGVGRPLPSQQFAWYLAQGAIRTSGEIPVNTTLLLTASWDTRDPWPTALPGTPA